jgi:hypothetical protein
MHYGNGYAHEQAERDKPLLLVGKPIVLKGERRPREHLRRINEVQAVGFQIGFALIFIPLVLHLRSVYTILTPSKGRRCQLAMRLSDARLRRLKAKLIYPNHRLPPWPNEDATPRDRSNRLLASRARRQFLAQDFAHLCRSERFLRGPLMCP